MTKIKQQEIMVYDRASCDNCRDKEKLDFDFTMAFSQL
jgi:hypothetical protein